LSAIDGLCVVRVLDNGVGLPQDERHRLTEPYVTTRVKGTGLGLAIVKKIIEDHGGVVTLDDIPTGGAAVTLTLAEVAKTQQKLRSDETVKTPLRVKA